VIGTVIGALSWVFGAALGPETKGKLMVADLAVA
jgi:hypothetical protein